ncbi:T9SS type A sorting domain-containing protein [Dyadobacter psychrotolerans]|uniref:T9SS type A sorting domain-containing protein n=1 Tax=Dyadobacter psychrotolerans TaxID=2541721 RepID=A0A4R5DT46_9BACT|nr:T9SS type A sorting domain-containing protein [Dyadobacter psychrotolerans]TDE17559.1 T9SS type A sorting domain-containing protein [Dyadobacter psychrotolerans]
MKNIATVMFLLLLSRLAFGQGGTKEVVICNGTNVRLKAASTGANGFEWRKDGQIIPGFSGSELLISEEGNYAAVALNIDGCASDQSVVIILEFRRPLAVNDFYRGQKNVELTINTLDNDQSTCAEFDPNTLNIKSSPNFGNVIIQNGKFLYTPPTGFTAEAKFQYSVKDKNGLESNVATVTLDYTAPLPVTLTAFNAEKKESVSLLTWTTSEELRSDRFEIQRSTDSKSWASIGNIAARANGAQKQNYDFTDELPESGINYYRLKMIDSDGTLAFSQIRSVHFPEFSWAKLYPNPVSHTLHISIRNKQAKKLRLINLAGQVLYRTNILSKDMDLNMQPYASGVYFVHLEQENGLVSIFKIMHE